MSLHQTSILIIDAAATVSLNNTLKKKLHGIIHDAGKEAEECYTGAIRSKLKRGRNDVSKLLRLSKRVLRGRMRAAWLFQFIPDYFSCLPLLPAYLSSVFCLQLHDRVSFLCFTQLVNALPSLFCCLFLPAVLLLLPCCFFISSIFSLVTSGYSACMCRAIKVGQPR